MHVPVMPDTVLEYLDCRPGGIYVDCTLGGGGHAGRILEKIGPDGVLIAMDMDEEAVKRAEGELKRIGGKYHLFNTNFTEIKEVVKRSKISKVNGILFDLGLSSFQIEDRSRGFSFINDGPLDMRMSKGITDSAEYYVNNLEEGRLNEIIFRYGEERWARRIAGAIVRERRQKRIVLDFYSY